MLIRQGVRFFRAFHWRVLLISALLLLPCFWHKRIEAGDLASHTYNAWLAQLIARGQAPGLYIQFRWDNVLSDIALTKLGSLTGFIIAEHVVVALAVLIFFWGAFNFISTASMRAAWTLVPAIAMIAYGWTFYAGFLNYYFSLGFAFWAVVLFWRGHGIDYLAGAVLACLTLLAHPTGLVVLVGLAIYLRLSDILRGWLRWLLFVFAGLVVIGLHYYALHARTAFWHTWNDFLYKNGTDQLILFGARYRTLAMSVLTFGAFCVIYGVMREWRKADFLRACRAPLELWILLVVTALMIPETILLPHLSPTPFGNVISRMTSVTAVLALCILTSIKPRSWHLAGWGLCALVFFIWTYQDTGILNQMERQAETLVSSLPYGRRVTSTVSHRGWRLPIVDHSVDRACIGRCFAYENYEPSSGAFRVRVQHGSPVVTDSVRAHTEMQSGSYTVLKQDLPMDQIYQCDEKNVTTLCMRELSAGEHNGSIGNPPRRPF
jgi:hypothetical protein